MDPKPRIRRFLESRIFRGKALRDDESFWETGAIDSVGILQLVHFLESSFDLEIPEKEITTRRFGSIDSVSEYVARKLREAPGRGRIR